MKEGKNMKALKVISIALLLFLFVPAGAQQRNNMENGHEYVDLGLSVKWATCNVGADKPEDYGDYYAWGETKTCYGDDYTWDNYIHCDSSWHKMTKYCTKAEWGPYGNDGFADGKTVLEPVDDVAHIKWGGVWRMPTRYECQELVDACTWTRTSINGVDGYKVTSNRPGYAGNYIFLPLPGWRDGDEIRGTNSQGRYWSASLYDEYSNYACLLDMGEYYGILHEQRYIGYTVRPVCSSETWKNQVSISLSDDNILLPVKGMQALVPTVKDGSDEAGYFQVFWSSSNPLVASVNETGVVKAVSIGQAVITAFCMGKTASSTVDVVDKEHVYESVDLGLSVNWATCNIGAIAPEGYGDYYAWGETETKDSCIWSNYKYSDGPDKMTKYSTKAYYSFNGDPDGKTTLEPADDVAHVKLGDGWRMPTREEFMELRDSCTWTWTTLNGVKGARVSGRKPGYEGNSIFLPAAGHNFMSGLKGAEEFGWYWSSALFMDYPPNACLFDFRYDHMNRWVQSSITDYYRSDGIPVRPVCP